jgi:type 1 fimbriae regulatory protein FimB/type 1 fimbriae regulatory protein FimE
MRKTDSSVIGTAAGAGKNSRKEPLTAKSAGNVLEFPTIPTLDTDDAQAPFSAKSNLPPRKQKNAELREREYLTTDEIQRLRDAAKKNGRYGFRDSAMILIAYRHGLRVGELVDLRWDQVNFDESKIHINRLKRGDSSVHFLEGDELRLLRQLKRETPGSAFVFSTMRQGPVSTRHVRTVVAEAAKLAGFEFTVHPHMLRHSRGYVLANRGTDTRAIQAYLGHRNIQHTVVYTQLDASRFKGFGKD